EGFQHNSIREGVPIELARLRKWPVVVFELAKIAKAMLEVKFEFVACAQVGNSVVAIPARHIGPDFGPVPAVARDHSDRQGPEFYDRLELEIRLRQLKPPDRVTSWPAGKAAPWRPSPSGRQSIGPGGHRAPPLRAAPASDVDLRRLFAAKASKSLRRYTTRRP